MGHRSSNVVVENGTATIHYSQAGALGLPDMLVDGPSAALAVIRDERTDRSLQTAVFCEGAALVDLDRRHLLWFGGMETMYLLPYRRAMNRLLAAAWPGWSVAAASRGVFDIAAYIGVDEASVRDEAMVAARIDPAKKRLSIYTIVTVANDDGVADFGLDFNPFSLMLVGPQLLDQLSPFGVSQLPRENALGGGILVDPAARRIRLWCGPPIERPLAQIREQWPGWQVTDDLDGLPHQVEATGRDASSIRISDEEADERIRSLYAKPRRS